MDRYFRKTIVAEGTGASPPREAWLFAQAILGKPIPSPSAAEGEARHKREQLEWLASISERHAVEFRRLQSAEAEARHQREQLEWLAQISEEHERKLRTLLREEAEARESQQRYERFTEAWTLQEAQWDPSKHPRLGGPPNAGWFATTGGSASTGKVRAAGQSLDQGVPSTPFQTVGYKRAAGGADPKRLASAQQQASGAGGANRPSASQQGPSTTGAGKQAADTAPPPTTKLQLPAGHRGTWVSGTKGDGVFRYNDSVENQKAGLAGKEVRFENQHIAGGGLPAEAYYGGNAGSATVEIPKVTGLDSDNLAADAAMRKKLSNPKWRRPAGYVWNHAGTPGSKAMELVKEGVHKATAHKGPAAEPRALRRAAGARGATGRAMAALTVYLTARDALQATGILQPDYEVAEREMYHYVSDDGSVFVVWPAGLISSAKREFVAGPRKGQTEKITNEQVDEYRKQAEEEWGKYIPGTLLSEPRFIPGKKRKSLPLIKYRNGIPYNAGWIDEKGIHRYSSSRELPI